jgi:sec-independent protein translocase protein TatC
MVFVMGLVFELPSLAWVLGKLGVVSRGMLRGWRRYAVVLLLVLAALITPTGDPFTLLVVFLPLYGLYELSVLVVPGKDEEEC